MTLLWPEMADMVGVVAHTISGLSACYLSYWCWRAWKDTRLIVAFALCWLGVIIALLSVYRFFDILSPAGSFAAAATLEFGMWIRIAHAVTLSYIAWYVWRLGRGRA
jgi:hypothetical protein